jgi:hypothetical protein
MPSFSTIKVQLTIVDSGGHTATAVATIRSATAVAAGVGSLDLTLLMALLALAGWRLYRRQRLN